MGGQLKGLSCLNVLKDVLQRYQRLLMSLRGLVWGSTGVIAEQFCFLVDLVALLNVKRKRLGTSGGRRAVALGFMRADSIRKYCFPCSFVRGGRVEKDLTHISSCIGRRHRICNSGLVLVSGNSVLRKRPITCCCGCVSAASMRMYTTVLGCVHCSINGVNGRSIRAKRTICSH